MTESHGVEAAGAKERWGTPFENMVAPVFALKGGNKKHVVNEDNTRLMRNFFQLRVQGTQRSQNYDEEKRLRPTIGGCHMQCQGTALPPSLIWHTENVNDK